MATNKRNVGNKVQNLLSATPKIFLIALVLLTVSSSSATGHIAETDENNCHYDHLDRYHCH